MTSEFRRRYHDTRGQAAGPVPMDEQLWLHWEKQTEALRSLLGDGKRRLVSLDELWHGFESYSFDKFAKYSFSRRRLEAMIDILVGKSVITRVKLDAKFENDRRMWTHKT